MKTKYFALAPAILLILLAGYLVTKGGGTPPPSQGSSATSQPEQFIVLLDLSDRITQPDQIAADKAMILKTFEIFEQTAKGHLLMNSKDRFQVCIAPQNNLPFNRTTISDSLTLDIGQIKLADRLKTLQAFKSALPGMLDHLYNRAYKGTDRKAYAGSNIWQFFNETLPDMATSEFHTRLVVITDGYFDFEDGKFAKLNEGKMSTTTNDFMHTLRKSADWKAAIDNNGYGIMPVKKAYGPVSVMVMGIRSKFDNNLHEVQMLSYIWEKWLKESNVSENGIMSLPYNTISLSSAKLSQFLKNGI